MTATPVLFIDDEEHVRNAGRQTLELAGFDVECMAGAETALARVGPEWPGVVVCDIKMPKMDGLAFLRRAMDLDADLPVLLITGHGDIAMAVQAMRDGAYDFIEKPFSTEHLADVVRRAAEKRRLTLENRRLRRALDAQTTSGAWVIGESPPVRHIRERIVTLADTGADVLVVGETGTGKELVARMLHEQSNRRQRNVVAVNCGALPENLIESELFGHEKGAFTGADKKRIGKFEHADGGTIFLDEIESMAPAMQVRLLRVIQERSIERLGSNEVIPLDLRVVAATKADLKAASEAGAFREDLYYRLAVVTLSLPPLRERQEDVPLLFRHFLREAAARYNLPEPEPTATFTAALMAHPWPGNVRELQNVADRLVLFGEGDDGEAIIPAGGSDGVRSLATLVQRFERSLIAGELDRNRGDVTRTTRTLGVPRKTLYDKMAKYGISRRDFHPKSR